MNRMNLALAGGATLALAGVATADLVGVSVTNLGDLGGGTNSYRVSVIFDAPDDQLLAVGGLPSVAALIFQSSSALINEASAFNGLIDEDRPNVLSAAWDSWLSVQGSAGIGNDTAFSPNFAGGDGATSVVNGTFFSETDGGYFDQNPGSVSGGVGSIDIAQFTLSGDFTFSGVVNWRDQSLPGGEFFSDQFSVTTVPAPGALALLGLAGLAVGRRRR